MFQMNERLASFVVFLSTVDVKGISRMIICGRSDALKWQKQLESKTLARYNGKIQCTKGQVLQIGEATATVRPCRAE